MTMYVSIILSIYFVNAKSSKWSHFIIINLLTSGLKSVKKNLPSFIQGITDPKKLQAKSNQIIKG